MRLTKIVSASINIKLWNEFCSKIENLQKNKEMDKKKVTRSSILEDAIIKFINKNK
tara:strand:+ start:552 stop:719 length:168 start_codon:yes stop_codon:yes gene_type:complete